MTKLSSTKLSPCVCGGEPLTNLSYARTATIECDKCFRLIGAINRRQAARMWNAAMRGLSMEGKEK